MPETEKVIPENGSDRGIEGFGRLSDATFLDLEQSASTTTQVAAIEEKVELTETQKAAAEVEAKLAEAEKKDKTETVVEKSDAEKTAETLLAEKAKYDSLSPEEKVKHDEEKLKADAEKSFVIEGEDKTNTESTTDADTESNWLKVGEKLGIQVKADDFNSFVSSYNEKLNEIAEKAKMEVKDAAFEDSIIDLPIESQLVVRGLKEGIPVEQIIAPLKKIEELKTLSDEDLVATDLRGQGYDEEYVELKIKKMVENEELVLTAKEIRKYLDNEGENIKVHRLEQIKELELTNKNKIQTARLKETEELKQSLNKIENFLDTPVSEKVRNYLMKGWESGKFHEAFKDPSIIAEFLIYKEFGKQGIANLKQKNYERGLFEKVNKLHNIPPVVKSGGSSVQHEEKKEALGNWSAFEHID